MIIARHVLSGIIANFWRIFTCNSSIDQGLLPYTLLGTPTGQIKSGLRGGQLMFPLSEINLPRKSQNPNRHVRRVSGLWCLRLNVSGKFGRRSYKLQFCLLTLPLRWKWKKLWEKNVLESFKSVKHFIHKVKPYQLYFVWMQSFQRTRCGELVEVLTILVCLRIDRSGFSRTDAMTGSTFASFRDVYGRLICDGLLNVEPVYTNFFSDFLINWTLEASFTSCRLWRVC